MRHSNNILRSAAVALGLILTAAPGWAHHSLTATYDSERSITLEGIVTRVEWVNPHAYLFLNVTDATGMVTNWAVEFGDPLDLERDGWHADAVEIGDTLRVDGIPARDASSKRAFARSVVLPETGETLFTPSGEQAPASSGQPAPRWPDGHPRLGPEPGQLGYWGRASAVGLSEADVLMNRDAILENFADIDRVAPFKPWSRAVYEYRQRTLLADDPITRCLPPGATRMFQGANGFQFIEQPELGRILVLDGAGNRNWRVIYTDGRPPVHADEVVQTFYGTSVGSWEGDTLVVDSVGFNEGFWFAAGGLPHTEALHLVERFTRLDRDTLRYEVTVDDPRTYTRQWNGGWTIRWVPDRELEEYFCEENVEFTLPR